MIPTGLRRALLGAGVVATLCATTPAWAHALLESSEPEEGALLDAAPAELVLHFTETPDTKLSKIDLLDDTGAPVETSGVRPDPADPRTLVVGLGELDDGVYTVSWRVLSTVDGHVTAGAYGFGVGVDRAIPPPDPGSRVDAGAQRPTPLSVAGRWGFYLGTAALLGLALAGLLVFGAAWRPRWGWVFGVWVAAALGLSAMLLAERSAVAASLGELLASDRGRVLLVRAAGLAIVGLAAIAAQRWRSRWGLLMLAIVATALMGVQAYAGHAGGATSMRWFKVGTQWVHLVGVGTWVGGLLWLWVGTRGQDGPDTAASVRRFSNVATVGIAAVIVTGGLRALDEVGLRPDRYFESGFGLTVLAKVALFLPLAGLGALNKFRNVPALIAGRGRIAVLRRAVGGEIAIATVILAITGIMAGLVPPTQAGGRPGASGVVASGSDFAGAINVRLTASPGTPGPNRFEVRLRDRDAEPIPARRVTLEFRLPDNPDVGASTLVLERADEGVWRGSGVNLASAGLWRIGVLIEQAGDSALIPVELRTKEAPQRITKSEIPGEPTIYTIELPAGGSVQAYVDPGDPGSNEVHFTFFSPEGGEQPIDSWKVTATPEGGDASELDVRELSPGHVVADADLNEGRWRFRVEARTPEGTLLPAYIDEQIGGEG